MRNGKLKMLRIAMTYPRDNAPGIGLHAYYYSMYSDYEEMILTIKRDGVMPDNREGVRVIEIEAENIQLGKYNDRVRKRAVCFIKKIWGQYIFLRKSKRYIDGFKPDIVHVFSPIPVLCGIYARRKFHSKIVMSLHGSDTLRMEKVKFLAKLLSIPDAVVTVGGKEELKLPDVKMKTPITYIGNGVDLNVFKNYSLERRKQFIHVANLRWQKGQRYLIEGFAQFQKNHRDYKLVIIGDGEEKENLKELCKEKNLLDAVRFLGTCGREEIAGELNLSQAFVLTSVTEGFPKVIIEAMATGTPVISSDVGNIKNVVCDSGIIFPPKNSKEVCKAMEKIVDFTEWEICSKRAERYAQQYSWSAVVGRLSKVYKSLLEDI